MVCRLKLGLLHCVDLLEVVIIPHIPVKLLIIHMIDEVHHLIQEGDVMGNEDERILIFLEIPFQPFNVHLVQIVGWLIQQQNVRFFQQQLAQKHLGPLSAAQIRHILVQPDV